MARKKQKPLTVPKISLGKPTEKILLRYSLVNFFQKNLLLIIIGVILILVVGGGFYFWNIFNKRAEEKASSLFYQAYLTYKNAKNQGKTWEEPMNLFTQITRDYPRTATAGLSFFYLGNCQFNLKKFDEAINSYTQFLSKFSSQPQLALLAYDSLGYCYEEKKDYKKALEYFQKTIDPPPGLGETGYLNVARCFEALGDHNRSLETYKKFLSQFPDSPLKNFIQEKINLLESKTRIGP